MDTNEIKHTKVRHAKKKRIGLWIVLGILVLMLIGGGIYLWHLVKRPEAFFDSAVRQTTTAVPDMTPMIDIDAYLSNTDPASTPNPGFDHSESALPSETESVAQPVSGIVNIALFGIDAYESGKSSSGSMPHTDANLVLAVNFDKKEISLISIARDCLTTAPGYTGFYKFNGVFNVGGGMQNPKAGFELSCRAAEEWLGGVSVPYYYGVDFQALIDLVDMIGGIDYNVDVTLYTLDRHMIQRGWRHLNGQGVMAYMRMRSTDDSLDASRTARQRKMLVAIFKKLKQEGKLSMIPELLRNMGDNVYTNTTMTQTVALVNFAKDIDPDSIQTYSIQGKMRCAYEWRYCFIDQQRRIDIIKSVYGIDASPMTINSPVYETFLHKSGFRAIQYLNITKKIFSAVHGLTTSDSMSEEQKTVYTQCWQDYMRLKSKFEEVDQWTQARYDETAELTSEEIRQRKDNYKELQDLEAKLKESADALNEAFGSPVKAKWNRSVAYWYEKDSDINEVYVDFR